MKGVISAQTRRALRWAAVVALVALVLGLVQAFTGADTGGIGVPLVLVAAVLLVVAVVRGVCGGSRELHRRHGIARDYVRREHS